jgi:hypothetical protein
VKLRGFVEEGLRLLRLPTVAIEMCGDERCRELYEAFTRPHARWRLIQNKAWGVALLAIPQRYDDYLRDRDRSHLRREVNRATRAGFTFARLDPLARLDEVLAINGSAEERQGRPMHPDYMDEQAVRRYFERASDVFGVTDGAGVLRAYLCLRMCGEVVCVERLLGHADALKQGVVWVLVTGAIRMLSESRQDEGHPTWFMYDMFSGASPGMRQFKQWIGCEPYRVSWSWRD